MKTLQEYTQEYKKQLNVSKDEIIALDRFVKWYEKENSPRGEIQQDKKLYQF